eukprot:797507-Amphidinium_carterae.1
MHAACQARVPGHSTGPVHDARAQSHAPAATSRSVTPTAVSLQPPLKTPPPTRQQPQNAPSQHHPGAMP